MVDRVVASEVLDALRRSISEEVSAIQQLVSDEDTCCVARDLRAERIRAYEHVLAVIRSMERWEW